MPFVSPVTTHDRGDAVASTGHVPDAVPPAYAVTVYDTGAPPPAPGTTVTRADASSVTAVGACGTFGAATGVIRADATDAALAVVFALTAVALNVYAVPFVSGVTTHAKGDALVRISQVPDGVELA